MTDAMMLAAARALGDWSPAVHRMEAPLLPAIEEMQEAAVSIAVAVGRRAIEDGVAPEADSAGLEARIRQRAWRPVYPELIADDAGCV